MSRAQKTLTVLATLALTIALPAWAAKPKPIDLSTPEGATLAQRKVQCSANDNEPTVYWFHGEGFSRVPGERDRKLFNVEGMNVRQCVTVNDPVRGAGWRLVSRELLFYVDPATGADVWTADRDKGTAWSTPIVWDNARGAEARTARPACSPGRSPPGSWRRRRSSTSPVKRQPTPPSPDGSYRSTVM